MLKFKLVEMLRGVFFDAFWSFMSFKDNGADGAFYAFYFHDFVFEDVSEFFYVGG